MDSINLRKYLSVFETPQAYFNDTWNLSWPYVDDIIIPAENENDAMKNLQKVLELCKGYGLDINMKKWHFFKKIIQFLGHVIEDQKISPSPEKTIW